MNKYYIQLCDKMITEDFVNSIKDKYLNSTKETSPEDSILITTANYQVTLREYNNDKNLQDKILDDILVDYIFTAPHSVTQWRNDSHKMADINTGTIGEILSKLTNSICISRIYFDYTDPNYDDYDTSLFQQLVVSIINRKKIKLLLDIHGLSNNHEYHFAIGTSYGKTIDYSCKDNLERQLINSLNNYFKDIIISINEYDGCNFLDISNLKLTTDYTGGKLITNVKENTKTLNFSSLQLEIANTYRIDILNIIPLIKAIYAFVNEKY